jgi:DUF1009 family protein
VSAGALGIVAGGGLLPRRIAEAQRRERRPYLVCAFEGHAPEWVADHPHAVLPFEKPGALFRALRAAGVVEVVFAGALARPALSPRRFDAAALRLAPRLLPLLKGGDDALLRALAATFEKEGFRVIGAETALGERRPLAPRGSFSAARPEARARADLTRALALARAIGAEDVGQGAVVAEGLCLGLETAQGTDALLDFVARTRPGSGGVLVKAAKPGQDHRLDRPALGPATARAAAAAGLSGLGAEAGGVLLLEPETLRAEADRLGLFLHGVD